MNTVNAQQQPVYAPPPPQEYTPPPPPAAAPAQEEDVIFQLERLGNLKAREFSPSRSLRHRRQRFSAHSESGARLRNGLKSNLR